MARRVRTFLHHGVYHVYCRVSRGEYVFDHHEEASTFVAAAQKMIEIDNLKILGWCLLSNHYHLVVRTAEIPLWRSMLRFHSRVARSHNRRRRVFGPLWQSRYRARIVLDERYFRQVIAYVHLNPVAAGLVLDPADWLHSGHRALIGLEDPTLIDPKETLLGFHEDLHNGGRCYLDSVRNVAEMRWARAGIRSLPWWKKAHEDRRLVAEDEIPEGAINWKDEPTRPEIHPPKVETLVELCSLAAGCPSARIRGRTKGRSEVAARQAIARLAVSKFNHQVVTVARCLGKHANTVSRWLGSAQVPEDVGLIIDRVLIALRTESREAAPKKIG